MRGVDGSAAGVRVSDSATDPTRGPNFSLGGANGTRGLRPGGPPILAGFWVFGCALMAGKTGAVS